MSCAVARKDVEMINEASNVGEGSYWLQAFLFKETIPLRNFTSMKRNREYKYVMTPKRIAKRQYVQDYVVKESGYTQVDMKETRRRNSQSRKYSFGVMLDAVFYSTQ